MNAPIGLYGHIDEQGVRFKNYIESVEVKNQSCSEKKVFQTWRPLASCLFRADAGERTVARLKSEGMDTTRSVACDFI